jgi:tetratricopeptide (TPR) repeat protein
VVLITWFLAVSSARKQAFALAQLEQAWATQDGGNLPLAASEFQRIATTYRGTDAAYQAVLSLNSTRLQLGQAQLAVDDLRQFVAANPPVRFRIPGLLLVAAGLENLARPAEAAEVYEQAAAGAELDFQKADALVSAARAWQAAGNRDRAMAALRQVVERYPETNSHAEAQVRLGELTVSQP